MQDYQSTPEADRIHFAVLAIEAGAKKMGISAAEMRRRLEKQDLIKKRLIKHYGLLHTQGIDWIADDITETLVNWEMPDSMPEMKGGNA